MKNSVILTNSKLLEAAGISEITFNTYLLELFTELPEKSISFLRDEIIINNQKCSLYDMKQMFIFLKLSEKNSYLNEF